MLNKIGNYGAETECMFHLFLTKNEIAIKKINNIYGRFMRVLKSPINYEILSKFNLYNHVLYLVANGLKNVNLKDNPQLTFFKLVYLKHPNYQDRLDE